MAGLLTIESGLKLEQAFGITWIMLSARRHWSESNNPVTLLKSFKKKKILSTISIIERICFHYQGHIVIPKHIFLAFTFLSIWECRTYQKKSYSTNYNTNRKFYSTPDQFISPHILYGTYFQRLKFSRLDIVEQYARGY